VKKCVLADGRSLRYVRRYAIDRIRAGVSEAEVEAIRKIIDIDETPLTEKQRGILLRVLEKL